jgi:metal-sulfur cluster biosynthetic enzyme
MTLALDGIDVAAINTQLDQVVDPELDESIVQLGFVENVSVDQPTRKVTVELRLPTFWCSPNFAFLMAHDAREAALRVRGVEEVEIVLKDHGQSDEISEGVSAGRGFVEIFPGETDSDLDELRGIFHSKAFGMRQEQLVRALLQDGLTPEELVRLRLENILDDSNARGLLLLVGGRQRLVRGAAPLARAYLERRRRIGLSDAPTAPLLSDLGGSPIVADDLEAHLQRTRRQRVSMTFNAMMCRGLLEARYGTEVSNA